MAFGSQAMSGMTGIFQSVGSFIAASNKAESDRKWQDYNNKMVRLQDGQNQNSITTNENARKERKHTQLMQVQLSETATAASVEVAAATGGTIGRSVTMAIKDVHRNAARARQAIEKDDDMQDAVTDNQRLNSAMGAQLNVDLRQIPGPSPASLMMGLGGGLMKMMQ